MFGTGNEAIGGFYPTGGGAATPGRAFPARRTTRLPNPALPGWAASVKRLEDIVIALLLLPLLLLIMLPVAVWIRLDSPGPALFRQRRIGFAGCEFHVLKFRTMHVVCAEAEALRQATRG